MDLSLVQSDLLQQPVKNVWKPETSHLSILHLLKIRCPVATLLILSRYGSLQCTFIFNTLMSKLYAGIEYHNMHWICQLRTMTHRASLPVRTDLHITNNTSYSVALPLIPVQFHLPKANQALYIFSKHLQNNSTLQDETQLCLHIGSKIHNHRKILLHPLQLIIVSAGFQIHLSYTKLDNKFLQFS